MFSINQKEVTVRKRKGPRASKQLKISNKNNRLKAQKLTQISVNIELDNSSTISNIADNNEPALSILTLRIRS